MKDLDMNIMKMIEDEELQEILHEKKFEITLMLVKSYKNWCKDRGSETNVLDFLEASCLSISYSIDQYDQEIREKVLDHVIGIILSLYATNTDTDIKVQ
jgi:hypothetical protein